MCSSKINYIFIFIFSTGVVVDNFTLPIFDFHKNFHHHTDNSRLCETPDGRITEVSDGRLFESSDEDSDRED